MNKINKFFSLLAAVVCLANPLSLMASHVTTVKDVAGTYQFSGDSNSFPAAPLGAEAQAAVGQIRLNSDGTVNINFANFTVVTIGGTVISTPFTNVQGTWSLGSIDGQGTLTLNDFPSSGFNPTFALSFKRHCKKISGFSAVITENSSSNLVTLIQAELYN